MLTLSNQRNPLTAKLITPQPTLEVLVPIRKSGFTSTPSRPSRVGSDRQNSSSAKNTVMLPATASPPWPLQYATASPSTPWPRQSSGSAKGLTEAMLEQYLASIDEKITESSNLSPPPQHLKQPFEASALPVLDRLPARLLLQARSTPLRPVRMSSGSHQKYSTIPKKGEGEHPPPMTMEQAIEAFDTWGGLSSKIEQWQDRIRRWFLQF